MRIGLLAHGVVAWANKQLASPPPAPSQSEIEAETLRAFLNNKAVMAEFAPLPSHYGLVHATTSKRPDGSYGLTEIFTADRGALANGSLAAIGQYAIHWDRPAAAD